MDVGYSFFGFFKLDRMAELGFLSSGYKIARWVVRMGHVERPGDQINDQKSLDGNAR